MYKYVYIFTYRFIKSSVINSIRILAAVDMYKRPYALKFLMCTKQIIYLKYILWKYKQIIVYLLKVYMLSNDYGNCPLWSTLDFL